MEGVREGVVSVREKLKESGKDKGRRQIKKRFHIHKRHNRKEVKKRGGVHKRTSGNKKSRTGGNKTAKRKKKPQTKKPKTKTSRSQVTDIGVERKERRTTLPSVYLENIRSI